jgi:hypothetical protein
MKKYLLLIAIIIVISSCSTPKLYNWKGYDTAVYSYIKKSDDESLEDLLKIYDKLIENTSSISNTPPPGVLADYGYLLVKKGEVEKGKELLKKETILYPGSKKFIDRILKQLEK